MADDRSSYLGEFELLVMLAVLHAGDDAYGVEIRREIEERSGRPVSRGAVYVTLDRLETKGFLESEVGDPLPRRGGRPRRFYEVTDAGLEALRVSQQSFRDMWRGLEPVLRRP